MDARKTAANLGARLEPLQTKLDKLVQSIAISTETSSTYWTQARRDITKTYEEMRKVTASFVGTKLPQQYDEALRKAIADIKATGFAPKTVHYNQFANSNAAKQSLSALLEETTMHLANGFLTGEATMQRLARLTQQVNVSERQVNKKIEEGYLEGGSPQSAAKKLREALLKKAVDGKYVQVVDKNGNTEMWDAKAYAEMVTRTKLMEATTQATVNAVVEAGGDLVAISAHNTRCEICMEFEGKIYSLSGASKDFPMADELPPYHPNCMHSSLPTFEEGLKADGTYDDYVAFSNGETEIHPTRESFIPVSQRKEE